MKSALFLAVVLALSAPAVAQGQAPAAQAPVASLIVTVESGPAYELAKVTNSEAMNRVQLDKLLNDTLPKQFAANPDFVELEAAFPGITRKVIDSVRSIAVEATLSALPILWGRIGGIYSQGLTEIEINRLLAFYRGPTGQHLLDIIARNADFSRAMNRMLKGEDSRLTSSDLMSGTRVGILTLRNELSPMEIEEVRTIEQTPLGAKMLELGPLVNAEIALWGNEPAPELDAKVEAAVMAIVETYIGGKVTQ